MDELIAHLQHLKEELANSVDRKTSFDESKKIYLRIKDANEKLRTFFEKGNTAELFKKATHEA